ncbi:hypothetical protein [Glutamicibacter sp. NPDC087583]|uniref:hypothetical protein n=1 Tax=Glutamicibacter sp. NPDC087583 TaxID=3363995 RepID=UPI00382020CE
MTELIPFTKTLTLQPPEPVAPETPAPMRMMAMAATEPTLPPSIHTLLPQARAEVLAQMHAAGITQATDDWIRSSMHREGSTVDTAKAFGILPQGAPARFAGGPLDGTAMPSELEPGSGQVPRLTRADGAYYELTGIDYDAGEYLYSFSPVDSLGFSWG